MDWIQALEDYAENRREEEAANAAQRERDRQRHEVSEARRDGHHEAATALAGNMAKAHMDRALAELMRNRGGAITEALRPRFPELSSREISRFGEELLERSRPRARFDTDSLMSAQTVADIVTITLPDVHYRFHIARTF